MTHPQQYTGAATSPTAMPAATATSSSFSSSSAVERYAYNAETLGVEAKSLDFVWQKRQLTARPHRADFYQLLWVDRGTLVLHLDFARIVVHAGEACFVAVGQVCCYDVVKSYQLNQDEAHQDEADEENILRRLQGRCVLFSAEFLGESATDGRLLHILAQPLAAQEAIVPQAPTKFAQLLQFLCEHRDAQDDDFARISVQSYLRILLAELACVCPRDLMMGTAPSLAQAFIELVEQHFHEWHNVCDYLDVLIVGEKTLSKAVQRATGYTPKVYLDQRRMLQAKRLLIYSQQTSKEIGYSLGFDEPTNFHKFFRKHAQLTPQEFRQHYVEK